jgi:ribonuclease HI
MKATLFPTFVDASRNSAAENPPLVHIYTDGGCSPNPGAGGWAAVLISPGHNNHRREISGAEPDSTNNRMELTAAMMALRSLKKPCRVVLHTDAKYLRDAFEKGWLDRWQRKGWKTQARHPVLNQDLWQELLALSKQHDITWQWVKGHADNAENNRCDELVRIARARLLVP